MIAQDEATSQCFAMPSAAIATGCVDLILPVGKIGPTLLRLAHEGRPAAGDHGQEVVA